MLATTKQPEGPKVPQVDTNLRLICRDCKDPVPNIVEDFKAGDLVCGNCGLILGNRIIDTRSEWRTFSNSDDTGDDPSRVGAASDPLLGGINHLDSTVIGVRDGGSGAARELNKAHGKAVGAKGEKQLLHAFKEMQAMCERIGLSKVVVDSAKQLYKKVEDEKLLRGKTQEAIMASCIYIACREQNVTRTFKEICALTKVSKKEIGRCYKALQPLFEKPAQQISLDSYISRFSSFLDLPPEVQKGTLM
ncbi:transcription initiation factor IIB, partial [Quaeritorhiza haematococci]